MTSNVPGARDAIVTGKNGLLINEPQSDKELAEAIEPLLDKTRRDSLSAAAPGSVARYQWSVVLRQYEAVLLECVSLPPNKPLTHAGAQSP